jgi:antitoxin ParD1/3/4
MAKRQTRTLSLTPEQASFVQHCVETGRYQSASEVVRAAIRLLEVDEAANAAKLQRARAMIQQGLDEFDRGESVSRSEFFKHWDERGQAKKKKRA